MGVEEFLSAAVSSSFAARPQNSNQRAIQVLYQDGAVKVTAPYDSHGLLKTSTACKAKTSACLLLGLRLPEWCCSVSYGLDVCCCAVRLPFTAMRLLHSLHHLLVESHTCESALFKADSKERIACSLEQSIVSKSWTEFGHNFLLIASDRTPCNY